MINRYLFQSILVLSILLSIFYIAIKQSSYKSPFKPPLFIAHASGGINGLSYLNSLESLNRNYELGIRYFEVDFSWTSDNHLVLMHDWKRSFKRLFNNSSERAPTLKEFLKMPMRFEQTQLSLKQFSEWMMAHPDSILVTDIKKHNLKGLEKMISVIDDPFNRIIPQVYHPKNYSKIQSLGFNDIFFATYRTRLPLQKQIDFIKTKKLFALSIRDRNQYYQQLLKEFGDSDLPIYYLVVNDTDKFKEYKSLGVDGGITDFLYLKDNVIKSHKETTL